MMNGRTFYAVESGGSRVIMAASHGLRRWACTGIATLAVQADRP
jgi:hypothetical protein